jgi:hypothetical protein
MLTSMNNLAQAFGFQGKYKAAGEMHRRTLELREKNLGPEHLDTLDHSLTAVSFNYFTSIKQN